MSNETDPAFDFGAVPAEDPAYAFGAVDDDTIEVPPDLQKGEPLDSSLVKEEPVDIQEARRKRSEEQKERLSLAFSLSRDHSVPDTQRALNVAKALRIPVSMVRGNLQAFESAAETAQDNPDEWLKSAPKELVSAILPNPDFWPLRRDKEASVLTKFLLLAAAPVAPSEGAQTPAQMTAESMAKLQGPEALRAEQFKQEQEFQGKQEEWLKSLRPKSVEEVETPEAVAAQGNPLAVFGIRYAEGRREAERSKLGAELLATMVAGGDTTDVESRLQDLEASSTSLALKEGPGMQVVSDLATGIASSVDALAAAGVSGVAAGAAVGLGTLVATRGRDPAKALRVAKGAMGIAGRAAAAAQTFRMESGSSLLELKDTKDDDGRPLDRDVIVGAAVAGGLLKTVVEMGEFELQLKALNPLKSGLLGGSKELKALLVAKPEARGILARIGRAMKSDAAKAMAGEPAEEGAQNLIDQLVKIVSITTSQGGEAKQDVSLYLALEAAGAAIPAGIAMGGAPGAVGLAIRNGIEAIELNRKVRSAEVAKASMDLARNESMQVAPSLFLDVMKNVAKSQGTEASGVYVDGPAFLKFFQGKAPEQAQTEAREAFGSDERATQALEQAVAGQRVQVALEELPRWAKSTVGQALQQDSAASPDGMTLRERTPERLKAIEDEAKKLAEQHSGDAKDVEDAFVEVDRIEGELRAAGYTAKESETAATLWKHFYRTQASRAGMRPEDFAQKMRITFGLVEPEPLVSDVDVTLAQRFHGQDVSTPEGKKAREKDFFLDRTTGLPNARAWKRAQGLGVTGTAAAIEVEGMKFRNDTATHSAGDDLMRAAAQALVAAGLKPSSLYSVGGGAFRVLDITQEKLDRVLADANADSALAGFRLTGQVATEPGKGALSETGQQMRAGDVAAVALGVHTDNLRKSNEMAPRGKAPLTAIEGAAPRGEAFKDVAVEPELSGMLPSIPEGEAFSETFHEADTGVLTKDGRDAYLETKPKAFWATLDLNLLRPFNDLFGKSGGDTVLRLFGKVITELGGRDFVATHVSGDEYTLHHDNQRSLEAFVARLTSVWESATLLVKDRNGVVWEVRAPTFGRGVGRSVDDAEVALRDDKAKQQRGGQRSSDAAEARRIAEGHVLRRAAQEVVGRGEIHTRRPALSATGRKGVGFKFLGREALAGYLGGIQEGAGGVGRRLTPALLDRTPQQISDMRAHVARIRDSKKKAQASAWLEYTLGAPHPAAELLPSQSIINAFAKEGFVDPEGVSFDESGRSLERAIGGRKQKRGPKDRGKWQSFMENVHGWVFPRREFQSSTEAPEASVEMDVEAVREAVAPPPETIEGIRNETGAPVRDDGTLNAGETTERVLYQTRDVEEWIARFEKNPRVQSAYDEAELKKFANHLRALREGFNPAIAGNILPDESFEASPVRKNADFFVTYDISTICPRQDVFTNTILAVERDLATKATPGGLILVPAQRHLVGLMLREMRVQPACWYCYGQAGRDSFDAAVKAARLIATRAIEHFEAGRAARGAAWEELFRVKELNIKWTTSTEFAEFLRKSWQQLKAHGVPNEVRLRDLIRSASGVSPTSDFERAFSDVVRTQAQGSTHANDPKGWASLRDDILRIADNPELLEALRSRAGLRMNSQTDFRPWHVIEVSEAIASMRAIELPAHAYTKETDFLEVFGKTGIKFNLSVAYARNPDRSLKRVSGRPVFDSVVGMGEKDVERWRSELRNDAGGMLMAHNDEALLAGLDDTRIDMAIPYHAGPIAKTKAIGRTEGARNFTSFQHEKWTRRTVTRKGKEYTEVLVGKRWVPRGEAVKVTVGGRTVEVHAGESLNSSHYGNDPAFYLRLAKTIGCVPKFGKLVAKRPDGTEVQIVTHPGYGKLIKDVARNPEQQSVPDPSRINWEAAYELERRWIEKNGDPKEADPRVVAEVKRRIQAGEWPKAAQPPTLEEKAEVWARQQGGGEKVRFQEQAPLKGSKLKASSATMTPYSPYSRKTLVERPAPKLDVAFEVVSASQRRLDTVEGGRVWVRDGKPGKEMAGRPGAWRVRLKPESLTPELMRALAQATSWKDATIKKAIENGAEIPLSETKNWLAFEVLTTGHGAAFGHDPAIIKVWKHTSLGGGIRQVMTFKVDQFDWKLFGDRAQSEGLLLQRDDSEDARGGIVMPSPTDVNQAFRVFLNPKADISTVAHESAHAFFGILQHLAGLETTPQGIKDDFAKSLEWLGVPSADKLTDEHHERIARGFEAYLFEGKAPSLALERVFIRFALWLRSIYRTVVGLNVELSPEIRGVFDRMLATDEEIAAHKAQRGEALPSQVLKLSSAELDLRDDEDAMYEAFSTRKLALHAAKERLRETESWWKEERALRLRAAKEAYDDLPDVQARRVLDGEGTGEPVVFERAAVEAAVGKTTKVRQAKEGAKPDTVAQELGYPTGKALLEAMKALPEKLAWAEAKADADMKEAYPGILEDRTQLRRMVADGFHAVSERRVLRDIAWLNRRKGTEGEVPYREVARRAAQMVVGKLPARRLDASAALRAERAASKAKTEAAVRGNWDAAISAASKELLNVYLYEELLKARGEREALQERASEMSKKKVLAKLGKASSVYHDSVIALLGAIGLGPEETEFDVGRLEALRAQLGRDASPAGAWADEILDALKPDWRDMTVDQLRLVTDALDQVEGVARMVSTALLDGQRVDKAELIRKLVEEMEGYLKKRPATPTDTSRTLIEKAGKLQNEASGFLLSPVDLVRDLSGDDLSSLLHRALVQPLRDAKHKEVDILKRVIEPILKAMAAMPKERGMELIDDRLFPGHTKQKAPPRYRYELLFMALNAGNESNLFRLLEGRGIQETELINALNLLEAEEIQWVQSVWDAFEALKGPAFDVEERVTGLRPRALEPRPLKLANGTLRGGYIPAVYDAESTVVGEKQALGQLAELMDPSYVRPSTPHSHTKGRIEGFSSIISLDPNVISAHLAQVAHDIAFREVLLSVGGLVLSPEMQRVFKERLGAGKAKQFLKWLKDIGSMRGSLTATPLAQIQQHFRAALAHGLLGYNTAVAMGDLANLPLAVAASELTLYRLSAGVAESAKNPVAAYRFVLEKSGEFRAMEDNIRRDLVRETKKLTAKGIWAKWPLEAIKHHAFVFMQWTQVLVGTPAWLGAYRQALAAKKTDADAVRFADDVLTRIFPQHNAVEASGIIRDKSFWGLSTLFYGFASRMFAAQHAILRPLSSQEFSDAGVTGKTKTLASISGKLLALYVCYNVLGELLMGRSPEDGDKDDDEPEDKLLQWSNWFARKLLVAPLMTVPFEAGQLLEQRALGKKVRPKPSLLTGALVALGEAAQGAFDEDVDAQKKLELLLRALALWRGLPLSPFTKQGRFAWDVFVEGEEPTVGEALYGPKK